MKILFVKNVPGENDGDYLGDSVFHGLKKLLGPNVIDSPKNNIMYKDFVESNITDKSKMPARGFTLYGNLGDDCNERNDIDSKIKSKYFDLIIFVRPDFGLKYWDLVSKHYSKNQIIFLDGMDPEHIYINLLNKGLYFKRELYDLGKYYGYDDSIIKPISFGYPAEKIQKRILKNKILATVVPGRLETYIFQNENDYYQDYNQSLFGETKKKGGWDCLRHYEILGSNCVPLWGDIKQCPEKICTTLPKSLIIKTFDSFMENGLEWWTHGIGWETYCELQEKMINHFKNNCTTEHVAKYLLDTHIQTTY